jgi:hypothetical protein
LTQRCFVFSGPIIAIEIGRVGQYGVSIGGGGRDGGAIGLYSDRLEFGLSPTPVSVITEFIFWMNPNSFATWSRQRSMHCGARKRIPVVASFPSVSRFVCSVQSSKRSTFVGNWCMRDIEPVGSGPVPEHPVGSSAHHSRRPLQGPQIRQPSDHSNQWPYQPPCYNCSLCWCHSQWRTAVVDNTVA